jgi:hypothetical protein
MSVQTRRTLAALVILAVLSGALVALVRKGPYPIELQRFIPGSTGKAASENTSNTTSKPAETDGSSDTSSLTLEELPDRDEGEQDIDQTSSSAQAEQLDRDDGEKADSTEQDNEQATNDDELRFQFSRYAPNVRKQIKRARRFYERARTHNELVQDPSISSDQRVEENSKARTNAQKSLDLLRKVKEKLENPDRAVNTMMKRVQKIYRKSYRRAKMWGGY